MCIKAAEIDGEKKNGWEEGIMFYGYYFLLCYTEMKENNGHHVVFDLEAEADVVPRREE